MGEGIQNNCIFIFAVSCFESTNFFVLFADFEHVCILFLFTIITLYYVTFLPTQCVSLYFDRFYLFTYYIGALTLTSNNETALAIITIQVKKKKKNHNFAH